MKETIRQIFHEDNRVNNDALTLRLIKGLYSCSFL